MTSGPDPSLQRPRQSQREMLLVYLGYLRADGAPAPTAEQRSLERARRGSLIFLLLVMLVVIGLVFGPGAVVVVAVVVAAGWALMTRADHRRVRQG